MVLSWFRKAVSHSRRPKAAKSQRPRYHKVELELLEDRTLLSGFVFTVDRAGDAGTADGVISRQNGDQQITNPDYGGDIRYVLSQTNTQFYAGSTIVFDTSASGINGNKILLSSGIGELKITQSTTITNAGGPNTLTIDGAMTSRVFNVVSQNEIVSITGLTITNGNAKPAPNNSGNQGGDIFNGGNLTLTNDVQ